MLSKIQKQTCLLILSGLFVCEARGQGTFQNLGFESADLEPIPSQPGVYVPVSDGIPNWEGFLGTNLVTQVLHNALTVDLANISILGPNYNRNAIIEGNYTIVLEAGVDPASVGTSFTPIPAFIKQSGSIPGDASSLLFKGRFVLGDLALSFAGQNLPILQLSTGPNYGVYGADISAFAGQSGELRFTGRPDFYPQHFIAFLDGIQFSILPIPEPSVFGLFTLGGLLLGWRFLCKRP